MGLGRAAHGTAGQPALTAAREAMLDMVPVIVHQTRDEVEVLDLLVTYNQHRAKTNEQIGREYNLIVEVETARAERRRKDALKQNAAVVENFPPRSGHDAAGKARD